MPFKFTTGSETDPDELAAREYDGKVTLIDSGPVPEPLLTCTRPDDDTEAVTPALAIMLYCVRASPVISVKLPSVK